MCKRSYTQTKIHKAVAHTSLFMNLVERWKNQKFLVQTSGSGELVTHLHTVKFSEIRFLLFVWLTLNYCSSLFPRFDSIESKIVFTVHPCRSLINNLPEDDRPITIYFLFVFCSLLILNKTELFEEPFRTQWFTKWTGGHSPWH